MKVYKSKKAADCIITTYDELIKGWGISCKEGDIENQYGKTHYITCGKEDGEPVILFHGVGDDSALMWIYNAKTLGQYYHLYAIDTMGGPGKSVPGARYDQSFDSVSWIDTILEALQLEKVHMIGTSNGGYLVMRYLVSRPDKVKKVIGIAASPSSGRKNDALKMMCKIFLPEALFPNKKNMIKLITKLSGEHREAFTDNPLIMDHFLWLLKGFDKRAMCYHKVHGFTEDELSIIRERAFLLLGDMDPFQQYGGKAAALAAELNARFYPDAGHGLNHEKAEAINEIILAILAGKITDIR